MLYFIIVWLVISIPLSLIIARLIHIVKKYKDTPANQQRIMIPDERIYTIKHQKVISYLFIKS